MKLARSSREGPPSWFETLRARRGPHTRMRIDMRAAIRMHTPHVMVRRWMRECTPT